ncbi:hypothetical protein NPIL_633501, partial [Nephila pilipes]
MSTRVLFIPRISSSRVFILSTAILLLLLSSFLVTGLMEDFKKDRAVQDVRTLITKKDDESAPRADSTTSTQKALSLPSSAPRSQILLKNQDKVPTTSANKDEVPVAVSRDVGDESSGETDVENVVVVVSDVEVPVSDVEVPVSDVKNVASDESDVGEESSGESDVEVPARESSDVGDVAEALLPNGHVEEALLPNGLVDGIGNELDVEAAIGQELGAGEAIGDELLAEAAIEDGLILVNDIGDEAVGGQPIENGYMEPLVPNGFVDFDEEAIGDQLDAEDIAPVGVPVDDPAPVCGPVDDP